MSIYGKADFTYTVTTAASTGDKLTFSPPMAVVVKRWGVIATAAIGANSTYTLDVIPKSGGTRVNGSVSSGYDVAGGSLTSAAAIAVGTGKFHEPKHDMSGTVSAGTGVSSYGGMLMLDVGDTAVIEVTDAADSGGATTTFFIEYIPLTFQAAQETAMTKVNS